MIEMVVEGLTTGPKTRMVWLRNVKNNVMLVIEIGHTEALSIGAELSGKPLPRPLTQDLFRNFLDHVGAQVEETRILELKDRIFYAKEERALLEEVSRDEGQGNLLLFFMEGLEMRTITLDMKSLAIGLSLGLLLAFLIGVAGCQQVEMSVAKYQMAIEQKESAATYGIAMDTNTGELFRFRVKAEKEGDEWILYTEWREYGESEWKKRPTPK